MKKIIFMVLMVCLCSAAVAQTEVHWGLKGGVNFAGLEDAADNNTETRTAIHVGGLAHIHLNRSWAIQPEVVYSAQGAEYANGDLKLNYINIPVLAQYMFAGGLRLQTGPQVGILASSEFKSGDTEVDIEENIKSTDFGWTFGAGYLIPKTGLGIDARYNMGISNISKTSSDLKNRVWQVGLFYQFRR